ncbi:MAG: site-2 protease family protein [bacterium]|nr:site-2 protease family protein [bacterium]
MNILIFFVILLVLVLVHEAGHFWTAKRFGIRVDEFGFGFPPKAMTLFKKGETEYTLNWLPIGGFVKIFGEDPNEENINGPDAGRSFVNKPKWQQAIVLFAGIFANFLLAWLLFSIGFMSGMPTSTQGASENIKITDAHLTVVSVLKDSPAEISGLKTGDKILYLTSGADTTTTLTPEAIKSFVTGHADKEIEVGYIRKNETTFVKLTPALNKDSAPAIGIAMDEIGIAKLSFFPALWEGLKLDWTVTKGTVVGLYTLIADGIRGEGSFASVSGPVGMVGIVGDASKFGFAYLLSFAALISVNLAIINLIPFPALDGGRLLFLLIEKIKGSRIRPEIANTANTIGFGILIILMIVVTYHDIVKLF